MTLGDASSGNAIGSSTGMHSRCPHRIDKLWIKHPFVLSNDPGGAKILVMNANDDGRGFIRAARAVRRQMICSP